MCGRREVLMGMALAALGAEPSRLLAQAAKLGADAGGADPYPGGYVVKAPPLPAGTPVVVKVAQGRLRGVEAGGIRYFRGVPFAKPPVGPLRFRQPQPMQPWTGIRPALANPPASLQPNVQLEAPSQGEDCLYLNIWAPAAPGPHPVYVYIHGGGNSSGYSLEHRVNGASFAHDGIVCINIGYRLGVLGFLELGALLGPDYRGSGNNGLRDQLAALAWVQANAAAFGGDPANVTIGGQSAGGYDVLSLVASPRSRGLFHRAISQSGSGHGIATLADAEKQAGRFVGSLVGPGGQAAELRDMPAARIVAAQGDRIATGAMNGIVDGDVLLDHPYIAARKGEGRSVALLMGANRDEMAVLGGGDLTRLSRPQQAAFAQFAARNTALTHDEQVTRFVSAVQFNAPTEIYADNHAVAGGTAYVYEWTWGAPSGRFRGAAFHGIETPFAWDNPGALAFRYVEPDPALARRAGEVHRLWTSFIRSGRPASPHVAGWRPWTRADRAYLDIGADYTIRRANGRDFAEWQDLLDA
ncbi:MAG: carboxylesterase/lipase family protein [Alphaproteobacteria bacterium]|nr:carboxylesterase/lipase family protein [Alphaproteobacteria bacterium]